MKTLCERCPLRLDASWKIFPLGDTLSEAPCQAVRSPQLPNMKCESGQLLLGLLALAAPQQTYVRPTASCFFICQTCIQPMLASQVFHPGTLGPPCCSLNISSSFKEGYKNQRCMNCSSNAAGAMSTAVTRVDCTGGVYAYGPRHSNFCPDSISILKKNPNNMAMVDA